MKKHFFRNLLLMVVMLSIGLSVTSFAEVGWEQDDQGRWLYMQENGAYVAYGWKEIDGKQYYFNSDGYMLSNTITPDGYYVGADGAWIPDGQGSSQAIQNTKKNTLTASINGVQSTFYLQKAKYSRVDDQYEVNFVSLNDNGEPLYKLYFRIDDDADGYYTEDSDDIGACYFSILANYNGTTGKWNDSYKAIKYSGKKSPRGSFEIQWNQQSDKVFDGYFSVELTNDNGQITVVDNADFQFTLGEQHEKAIGVKTGSSDDSYDASFDTGSSSGNSSSQRNTEYPCPRCGGTGNCPVCHGAGYTYHEFLGRSSKDNCPYCNWGTCSRCNGSGRVSR